MKFLKVVGSNCSSQCNHNLYCTGDFVIEYVGEMIDEDEYKRRLADMHERNEDNFYFLTIDKDRMLDAGPKGNVARYVNKTVDEARLFFEITLYTYKLFSKYMLISIYHLQFLKLYTNLHHKL